MSLYDSFETDVAKEQSGVEVAYAPNKDGSIPTFVVRATSKANQSYAKAVDKATKPYRGNVKAIGQDNADRMFMEIFVNTILVGWKNIQDKFGKDIPFTKEAAIKLFKDLPRLYDDLYQQVSSVELFKSETKEVEAGN